MRASRLICLLLLVATPLVAVGQTVADRLRELDRLRAEGIISESVYDRQWNEVLEDAMRTPRRGAYPGVPKLGVRQKQPKWELVVAAAWLNLSAGSNDIEMVHGNASLGVRFTRHIMLTAGVDRILATGSREENDATGASAGIEFIGSKSYAGMVPFAGAGIAWYQFDDKLPGSDDDLVWEARAGLRQFFGKHLVVKVHAKYLEFFDRDIKGFGVGIGAGIRF